MSQSIAAERRRGKRRKLLERRSGRDRRSVTDWRERDRGPAAAGLASEQRAGWKRRISERRSGRNRRCGIDRRAHAATAATLDSVAIHTGRWLVSRLFHAAKSHAQSESDYAHLAEARTEILKLHPDLDLITAALDDLEASSIAEFPEYGLARDVLRQVKRSQATNGSTASKGAVKPLRATLARLHSLVAAPLESRVKQQVAEQEQTHPRAAVKKAKAKRKSVQKKSGRKKSTRKKTATKKAARKTAATKARKSSEQK